MSEDAVTDAREVIQPLVEPYAPFPSFEEWSQVPLDRHALDRFVTQLQDLKNQSDAATLDAAVKIATRWAAVNTGAIEGLFQVDRGFTYSVAASAAAWQGIEVAKGEFAAASIEDAMRAYDFVLDAATGAYPITEAWVRELHELVAASQERYTVITAVGQQEQPLTKGVYKTYPNNPLNFESNTIHSYASPTDTPAEMARLVEEFRSESFANAHPVTQAAYAHYAFVSVHPFADGNGRVARALASTFLYRGLGVPLVIFADQKADYLNALEAADAGSYAGFLRFLSERVIDTIGMIREEVLTATVPDVAVQMDSLRPLLSGQGGLAHQEIDAITLRVQEIFAAALDKVAAENPLGPPMQAAVSRQAFGVSAPRRDNYRRVPGNSSGVRLQVASSAPASSREENEFLAQTRLPSSDVEDFIVVSSSGQVIVAGYLRELHPTVSQAFVFRAEAAALRELRILTAKATAAAEKSLRDAGYL